VSTLEGGRPVGPYTPVVRCGEWVITSGQVGALPGPDGKPQLVEGGTESQLRQALQNLSALLGTEGLALADVKKATVFLVNMADYAMLNEVWTETFPEPRPSRSAVAVAALPLGAMIEVEAWAYRPEG
jgi:2-iminobutanoate/2-iminopropanoate deaminase